MYYLIPNTAIAVMSGMTFMTSVCSTPELDAQMLAMFKEMGDAMLVEERLMDAGMALASCGIAYVSVTSVRLPKVVWNWAFSQGCAARHHADHERGPWIC